MRKKRLLVAEVSAQNSLNIGLPALDLPGQCFDLWVRALGKAKVCTLLRMWEWITKAAGTGAQT
jgi:hypothetical protein